MPSGVLAVAKRLEREESRDRLPERFRYTYRGISRSEWWDETEPLPEYVDVDQESSVWAFRATRAKRRMKAARNEWLKDVAVRPEGITEFEWRWLKGGNSLRQNET